MSAQARRTSAMEALMQVIVDRGTLPQRRASSQAQFVRAPDGREITLQKADNQLTPEGKVYWAKMGLPAPSLYAYDQPLIEGKYVRAYNSKPIEVREKVNGVWKVTKKGEGYFRFNRTEYQVNIL